MKSGWTKAFSGVVLGAICSVGVMSLTCGGPTAPKTSGVTLSSLVITNQISGWKSDSLSYFVDSSIYNFVDGGSSTYCGTCSLSTLKAGFLSFLYKVPAPADTERLKMFVIQYATSADVQAIFSGDSIGSSFMPESALAPYSISEVLYTNNGSEIHAYGHFNNFFVELKLTGYATSGLALPDASTFMNYFHSKIVQ
jgi:hypothetical protein